MKNRDIISIYIGFIFYIVLLLVSGCNIFQNIFGGKNTDATPPLVVSVSPKDGEEEVPVNTSIIIEFSETMDENATENAITVLPSISGEFDWSEQSMVLTLFPDTYLAENTTYTIKIDTTAKDLAGNALEQAYIWMFQTGSSTNIDTTPPSDVSEFTAIPGDGQVELIWTNPDDTDLAGVLVVFRNDKYPADPSDGIEVYTGSGTNYIHTGLTNGMIYYYSIFTYDGIPNYSPGVQTSATPTSLSDGLIAYFPFNGNANDESGNGNDLELPPGREPALTTDKNGLANHAYFFDNSNADHGQYLFKQAGNQNNGFPENEGSFTAWFCVTQFMDETQEFWLFLRAIEDWSSSTADAGGTRWGFGVLSNECFIGVHTGTRLEVNFNFNPNEWYFIAIVWGNSGRKIYINGQLLGTDNVTPINNGGSAFDWFIGNQPYSISLSIPELSGKIDEIRIYNRVLSDTEIIRLYNLY